MANKSGWADPVPASLIQDVTESTHSRGVDEMAQASRDCRQAYSRVTEQFNQSDHYRHHLLGQSRQMMRDLGVSYHLYRDDAVHDHIVPFDPYPRIIGASEWEFLARGIAQRAGIWNAFLKDIYSTQESLKAGVVPVEWVYADRHFHRGSVGVKVPHNAYVHVAAFDLVRDASGRWVVIEDYVSNTTGAVYALQARNVLTQTCPELTEGFNFLPVSDYPTTLLEHLRGHAQSSASEPRVVLYSPGPYNHAWYEHSSLARLMGVPLVQGSDLIVLNSRVFLKTIGGLEPIDVIYRRMDETFMDPLEFDYGSQLGVAGLMNCVRKGSVSVVNAFGAALGNNRAIPTLMSRLARFYFNEALLLPTCDRFVCSDSDQREQVLSHPEDYQISHVTERQSTKSWSPRELSKDAQRELLESIRRSPGEFVAEPSLPMNLLPGLAPEGVVQRHCGLRLFTLGGTSPTPQACALTRYATKPDSKTISSGLGGGIKDTWVLQGEAPPPKEEAPIIVSSSQRRLRLGSRTADSLFWMGRYAERADNAARILQVMAEFRAPKSPTRLETNEPLLEALGRSTGHAASFFKRRHFPRKQSLNEYVLLDARNGASVYSSAMLVRGNARQIREALPPEVWVVISRLGQMLTDAHEAAQRRDNPAARSRAVHDLEDRVIDHLNELCGVIDKTMLRSDGWRFWHLGVCLERALNTIQVMRPVFMRRTVMPDGTRQRDDRFLDALLGMVASRYAYRSLYQTRPTMKNVARLLLQDEQLPHSVLFSLKNVERYLTAVAGPVPAMTAQVDSQLPLRQCAQLTNHVEFADLEVFFGESPRRRAPRFSLWLDQLAGKCGRLSAAISDHYLHHQAFNILR